MNILIIEDDKVTLMALQSSIQNLGYNVTVAETAEEAINLNKPHHLILSDMMMPGISGLSLLESLRTVQQYKSPIIMMSVLNNKSLRDAAFAAGANDFISKPIAMEELTVMLKKYENFSS